MKHIIMALAITALAYGSAEAQVYCKAKTVKHKTVRHAMVSHAVATKTTTQATSCRVVPFQACKIMPDRRTVSCYETTDLQDLKPLNSDVTFFGPTGDLPGQAQQQPANTVIIKGQQKGDYCSRDNENRTTTCFINGPRLMRDENGYYNYR